MALATSTAAIFAIKSAVPATVSAVAVFVSDEKLSLLGDAAVAGDAVAVSLEKLWSAGGFRGKVAEVAYDLREGKGPKRVYAVGVGPAGKVNAEVLRKAAGAIVRQARKDRVASVAVVVPGVDGATAAVTTALVLASWDFRGSFGVRRTKESADRPDIAYTVVSGDKAAFDRALTIATATNLARTVANRPGNDINPVTLAGVAAELAKEAGLKLTILDEKALAKLGCGGLLAVGGGSTATPPRLIALEYNPPKAKGSPLLVVGKSITFDTGGISIKPADKMQRMIYDKSGGMAVLGLMKALSVLKPAVRVVGLLAAAENHVSSQSYRPGDVLTLHNGVTVEITNTDAEGRLVLADAISWGIKTYEPSAVVDLATLTGGCVVALGTTMAGLFSNSEPLAAEITAAAESAGEKLWRLPVGEEQRDMLKSDHADIINSAGRWASPLTGAAFITFALPDRTPAIPWAHLDIAGVADTEKELPYHGKGATGFGVRTLVEWVVSRR